MSLKWTVSEQSQLYMALVLLYRIHFIQWINYVKELGENLSRFICIYDSCISSISSSLECRASPWESKKYPISIKS